MNRLTDLFNRDLAVYRVTDTGEVDRYGNRVVTRALVATWRGAVQPVKSAEGEAFVVDTVNFFVEPAADLRPADEFETGGDVYQIEGAPWLNRMTPPRLDHWSGVAKRTGRVSP